MLLGYGARNCWGFREWIEIDFTVKRNVSSDIAFLDKRVVPALCFEGANASVTGGVLIFDELDTHLHSDIVPEILRFFTDANINRKNAQIIFSSHLVSLMDILKKYRIYLFKKLKGESICYRVDELKGNSLRRNDRSLEQLYKSGALGGLPDVTIKSGTF